MYCCPFWFNSTSSSVKHLNIVRTVFFASFFMYSASAMFVTHGIPSFYEILCKINVSTIFQNVLVLAETLSLRHVCRQ